jgi:hypothetical protein
MTYNGMHEFPAALYIDLTYFVILNAENAGTVGVVPKRHPKEVNPLFFEVLTKLYQVGSQPKFGLQSRTGTNIEVTFPFNVPFAEECDGQETVLIILTYSNSAPQGLLDSSYVCLVFFFCEVPQYKLEVVRVWHQ